MKYTKWQQICNCIVLLYTIIVVLIGMSINEKDKWYNLTIYTQALEDWSYIGWQSLEFMDSCPKEEGYKAIGSLWLGTVEGNFTYNGVKVANYRGEIAATYPFYQEKMFSPRSQQILCGKILKGSFADV